METAVGYFEPLTEARAIDEHRVEVVFGGGAKGVFDCAPYFGMGYYKKLNNPAFFKCAHVSYGDLAWPDDIDIGADDVWEECVRLTPNSLPSRKGGVA